MKLLIVNADDFGLNASANAGIIECYRAGAITSTTLMANTPGFDEAIDLAAGNRGLAIGLHFNLTWGKPVSPPELVRTLVTSNGSFHDRASLGRRAVIGLLRRDELELELSAQFQRLRSSGLSVSHVDTHQHVHILPGVFAAIAKLCRREGLPMRVPWPLRTSSAPLPRRAKRTLMRSLLAPSVYRWAGKVRWNEGLGSVFDLGTYGGQLGAQQYNEIIGWAPAGSFELMVHPVADPAAMDGYTRIGSIGHAEYLWLRRGELMELAQAQGFRLGTYADLVTT